MIVDEAESKWNYYDKVLESKSFEWLDVVNKSFLNG